MKNLLTDDTNGDGEINKNDGHNKHTYNLPALVTTLIGAFQQHVEDGDDGGGEIDLSAYATKTYVNDAIDDIELTPGPKGDKGDKGEPGEDGVSVTNVSINSSNHLITTLSDNRTIDAGALPSGSGNSSLDKYIKYVSGDSSDYPYPPYSHLETNLSLCCGGDVHIDQGLWIYHNYSGTNDNPVHATVIDEGLVSADRIHASAELRLDAYDNKESLTTISLVKDSNGTKKTISAIDLFDAVEAHTSFRDSYDKTLDTDYLNVRKIIGGNSPYGERMKYVEFEDAICVKQIFSPNKNVNWLGDLTIEGNIEVQTGDIDLHIGGIKFPDGSRLTSAGSNSDIGIPYDIIEYSLIEDLNRHKLGVNADVEVSNLDVSNTLTVDKFMTQTIEAENIEAETIDISDANMSSIGSKYAYRNDIEVYNSLHFNTTHLVGGDSYSCDITGVNLIETNALECQSITFPDGSRLTSAGSVATVSEDLLDEQQNTIQQQQEKIASLEARIARLEEMLNNN
jgi:hypothetical protein